MDAIMVWHPVPVEQLGKDLATQENFNILKIADGIDCLAAGRHHELEDHPEVLRWLNHVPALYDRYEKSIVYLTREYGVEILDQWPHPPITHGPEAVYPDDSEEFVREAWASILVRGLGIEF